MSLQRVSSLDPELGQELLQSVSRSFYLSLRFLEKPVRPALSLGYLLARTSDTLADSGALPVSERISALNAFSLAVREETPLELKRAFPDLSVTHPGENALLEQSPRILLSLQAQPEPIKAELKRLLATIISGQSADLSRFGEATSQRPAALKTPEQLVEYTYQVAGCVGEFWTKICLLQLPRFSNAPSPFLEEHGRLFGQALQLVNILRDLPGDLESGRCYLPESDLCASGLTPASFLQSGKDARPVFMHWLETARQWLRSGEKYARSIRGIRSRFSVILPRLLAEKTLASLEATPPLECRLRVKIPRSAVLKSAIQALAGAMD